MYKAYFNFTQAPFSIAPDPAFLYLSDGHREALAHLLYGVGKGGGFVLLPQGPGGLLLRLFQQPELTEIPVQHDEIIADHL